LDSIIIRTFRIHAVFGVSLMSFSPPPRPVCETDVETDDEMLDASRIVKKVDYGVWRANLIETNRQKSLERLRAFRTEIAARGAALEKEARASLRADFPNVDPETPLEILFQSTTIARGKDHEFVTVSGDFRLFDTSKQFNNWASEYIYVSGMLPYDKRSRAGVGFLSPNDGNFHYLLYSSAFGESEITEVFKYVSDLAEGCEAAWNMPDYEATWNVSGIPFDFHRNLFSYLLYSRNVL
jgi:hypothetical protein